jgi:hypothetical protein
MEQHLPLDVGLLSSKFDIDPTSPTGLRWKVDHWKMKAGSVAGCVKSTGHCIVNFYGKRFHVHRIVWAIHNQADPGTKTVDHIDRNPANNAPENLRLATYEGQLRNTSLRQSLYGRGVHRNGDRYYARICIGGKDVALGGFATPEEAFATAQCARAHYLSEHSSKLYPAY